MTPGFFTKNLIAFCLIVFFAGCSSKSKEELLAKGMAELKKGNPHGAVICFKSALETDPKFYEARHQLAKAYLLTGRPELSTKEFIKLLNEDNTRAGARLELARAYVAASKPDKALTEAEAYVQLYGANAEAFEMLGIASAAMGKPDVAEAHLKKALTIDPAWSSAKLTLASLFQQMHSKEKEAQGKQLVQEVLAAEPKNVRAYFMLAMQASVDGNTDGAISIYRKILEIDSANLTAHYRIGLLYLAKGDIQQCDQAADFILKEFPKKSEGIRLKGLVNYHRKNYTEAIASLQQSISIQHAPEAYFYLGLCHFSIGELELALNNFKRVGGRNLFSGPAIMLTAMTHLKQQRFTDASAVIKPFLTANPGNALAHNIMGSAMIGLGLHDEGMAEFNKAVELDRRLFDAYLNKGTIHLFRGNVKDAEIEFDTALQVSPELLNARLVLANLYAREKNHDKALALLQKGLNGKKDDAIIYNFMATIMFARAMNEEGLKYLLSSKKADPAYLTAGFNIATYYSANNNFEKAFDEYREILEKSPQNAKALINIAMLKELKGEDKEALNYYKKAVKTKESPAYLAIAYYYLRKEETKKALSSLDAGIAAVARNIEAMEMKRQILTAESRFDDALQVCDDMETVNPQFGMHKKIETYLSKKDISKAEEHALRYISRNPSSAFAYLDLATVYEHSGELEKAVVEIKKSIEIDRKSVAALQRLGDLYARKKDFKSASNVYWEILRKNPDFIPAMFSHARMLEETGNKTEAKNKYREILVKSENYVPALNNLAYLNIDGFGSPQEGLRLAFLASRLAPSSSEVMDTLGYALLMNGRRVESRQVLEKASKLLPNNPTVTYHLALAYLENGESQKGVTHLQKSLAMGNFPEAELAKKLLSKSGSR